MQVIFLTVRGPPDGWLTKPLVTGRSYNTPCPQRMSCSTILFYGFPSKSNRRVTLLAAWRIGQNRRSKWEKVSPVQAMSVHQCGDLDEVTNFRLGLLAGGMVDHQTDGRRPLSPRPSLSEASGAKPSGKSQRPYFRISRGFLFLFFFFI